MISRRSTLVFPHRQFGQLREHLFPSDGCEAAALLLCSSSSSRRQKFLVTELVCVPYAACTSRSRDSLVWPGEFVEEAIDRACEKNFHIIAMHSHPGGMFAFSQTDNESDATLMPALLQGTDRTCGSAIMVPSGAIRARLYNFPDGRCEELDLVSAVGHDISYWWNDGVSTHVELPLPFTGGMTAWLKRLSACVIGVSGTGSIVAEQLARLGFGEIILIDFDAVELRNLNRILNASQRDADLNALKVDVFARAVRMYRADCSVVRVPHSIATREAVLAACEADVLFSCVDSAEGRHIADRLAAFFAMPLVDVGVSIPVTRDGAGEPQIVDVYGRVDYVYPGGSTLLDRGVYDGASLEAEYLSQTAPEAYRCKVADGYLRGVDEQAPAVISLNMRAASAAVMEFIARAFPFRHVSNSLRSRTIFMLAEGHEEFFAEEELRNAGAFPIATGLSEPLLGLPALSASKVTT